MKKYLLVFALVFGLLFFGCTAPEAEPTTAPEPEPELTPPVESPSEEPATPTEEPAAPLGSDRDEHGCIPSAGYEWCESLQECIRPWETECPETPMVGNDTDEHGCIGSAGYEWCESLGECIRPWETECPTPEEALEEKAKEFCGQENVNKVYVCGDSIRVVSSLIGGGSTIYDKDGNEVAQCPVVGPDAMSGVCRQYIMGDNCIEKEIC